MTKSKFLKSYKPVIYEELRPKRQEKCTEIEQEPVRE